LFKIILLFSTILSFSNRYVCTCAPVTIEESIEKADIIFIAKVLKVDTVNIIPEFFIKHNLASMDSGGYTGGYLVALKFKRLLKGENQADTIYIMTGLGNGDCGYYFKLQSEYLVYADKQEYLLIDSIDETNSRFTSHKTAYFTTNSCDRTTHEIKKEERLLKAVLLNKK
jgi:hypothetical protein